MCNIMTNKKINLIIIKTLSIKQTGKLQEHREVFICICVYVGGLIKIALLILFMTIN